MSRVAQLPILSPHPAACISMELFSFCLALQLFLPMTTGPLTVRPSPHCGAWTSIAVFLITTVYESFAQKRSNLPNFVEVHKKRIKNSIGTRCSASIQIALLRGRYAAQGHSRSLMVPIESLYVTSYYEKYTKTHPISHRLPVIAQYWLNYHR